MLGPHTQTVLNRLERDVQVPFVQYTPRFTAYYRKNATYHKKDATKGSLSKATEESFLVLISQEEPSL